MMKNVNRLWSGRKEEIESVAFCTIAALAIVTLRYMLYLL